MSSEDAPAGSDREAPPRATDEGPPDAAERMDLSDPMKLRRPDLLKAARALGLTGVARHTKGELASAVVRALRQRGERSAARPPAVKDSPAPANDRAPSRQRTRGARPEKQEAVKSVEVTATGLDPAPVEPPSPVTAARGLGRTELTPTAPAVENIPWSYGQDRVTAAAVDPETLFVYWEATDPAIAQARAALGNGGPGAWLNLRVYDTSGLIFDGTNAHSYFDHRLERWDRQWFFQIGKPSSSAVVELGLKSTEGFFVRLSRSSRVDFPRREPAPWTEPEWVTVLPDGDVLRSGPREHRRVRRDGSAAPTEPSAFVPIPLWIVREPGGEGERRFWELLGDEAVRTEWFEQGGDAWFESQGRTEWDEPAQITSWEAGPFSYPVEVEPPTRLAWQGGSAAYTVGGVTRVVYGPWRVVIRSLGRRSERRVLARWRMFRSWVAHGGEAVLRTNGLAPGGGASERSAASAWLWLGGSELRMGGASEVFRVGASELRLRGASERLLRGSSQLLLRGASERRRRGASERRLGGASERRLAGASERRLGGASERRLGGASELRLAGASEQRFGGSEERLAGAVEPWAGWPGEG